MAIIMKREFRIPAFLISLFLPLVLGFFAGLASGTGAGNYAELVKPPFAPPAILFPIVWTVLYLLMGLSAYLVYLENPPASSYIIYFAQLIVNLIWPFIFFGAGDPVFAFIWILVLWVLIIFMIANFIRIRPLAGLLQIPYLLWVTFAAFLNLATAALNQ